MWEVTFFGPKIWSGFGELGSTTPPRIPRSKHPPPHPFSMELCWAAVRATCRKQQTPQLWMEGAWAGQVYTVLLSKVTMSQQFYPWLQAVIWTSAKNEWNAQNTIFFFHSITPRISFYLFLCDGEPRLHKPSGFFWAPLPTLFKYVFLYCIIFGWIKWTKLNLITFFCTLWSHSFAPSITCYLITQVLIFHHMISDNRTGPSCSKVG